VVAISWRSILLVASLQAALAIAALLSSPTAAIAAAAIGVLAVGRYFAVACFTATLGSDSKAGLRAFAGSAWAIGMLALAVAVAAVAVKARQALPWAALAAFAGPVGMSAMAFGTGIGALVSGRPGGRR
jgi:hypothetical protein